MIIYKKERILMTKTQLCSLELGKYGIVKKLKRINEGNPNYKKIN